MAFKMTKKEAWQVEVGDTLVNIGKVTARNYVGVFHAFEVETWMPNLTNGKVEKTKRVVVFHSHDDVFVDYVEKNDATDLIAEIQRTEGVRP